MFTFKNELYEIEARSENQLYMFLPWLLPLIMF